MRGLVGAAGLLVISAACASETDTEEVIDGTGITVELFEPGLFSTELPEFATARSPSGDTLFFNRTPPDRARLDLFVSYRNGDGWTEPVLFEPTEGTSAIDPFVSHDGRRLYFSSNVMTARDTVAEFGIWFTERTADGWGEPVRLPTPVWSDSSEVYTSMTRDGRLFFSSWRDGVRRIYWTEDSGSGWSEPQAITFTDPSDGSNPMISPDGVMLVFSATRGAEGDPDLYVACVDESGWSAPQRLPAPINSPYTEFAPSIWGEDLYFTSERPGVHPAVADSIRPPGDLYRTDLAPVRDACRDGVSSDR